MLELVPLTISDALVFIDQHHRHKNQPPHMYRFAVGLAEGDELVAACLIGEPVNRHLMDGFTAEVIRLCTLGQPNACSMLYGAAWRAAKALGYRRIVTYTHTTEPGTSLVAAGWKVVGEVTGRHWNTKSRPRAVRGPPQDKFRWEKS